MCTLYSKEIGRRLLSHIHRFTPRKVYTFLLQNAVYVLEDATILNSVILLGNTVCWKKQKFKVEEFETL